MKLELYGNLCTRGNGIVSWKREGSVFPSRHLQLCSLFCAFSNGYYVGKNTVSCWRKREVFMSRIWALNIAYKWVLALIKDFNKGRPMFECIFFYVFEFFYSEECTSEGLHWKQVRMWWQHLGKSRETLKFKVMLRQVQCFSHIFLSKIIRYLVYNILVCIFLIYTNL